MAACGRITSTSKLFLGSQRIVIRCRDARIERSLSHCKNCRFLSRDLEKYSSKWRRESSQRGMNSSFHLVKEFSTDSAFKDLIAYERIVNETLDDITYFFETLGDKGICSDDYDVEFSDGVLTVHMGGDIGTYVINKQTPNRQIWLSSPISGPKRYDYSQGSWIYAHDGVRLHQLLSNEISQILEQDIDLTQLTHGGHGKENMDY